MDISIICFTYNHEKYIRKALEGILMQKGNFEYEIIIHDDASTDGTAEILKEYQRKYPDKIILILQKENLYSRGIKDFDREVYPRAKGKYIAICEGDDFWTYERKLQEQYDLMQKNPNISLCYHNALIYREESDMLRLNVQNHPSGYIDDRDVINVTKGWYPTASILCRTDYMKEIPKFCISTSDESWRTYMACRGDLYYINRPWSVYREFSLGGWNTEYYHNKKLAQEHFRDTIDYFNQFNIYSQRRFEKYIKERVFLGIHKYRDAHYGMGCSANELRICLSDLKEVTEHRLDSVLDEYYSVYGIRCSDYYKTTIEEQLKEETELYIYGAGNEAMKALIELYNHHMCPKGFIISDTQSAALKLLEIPVYKLNEFMFDDRKKIWPCLIEGREQVLEILKRTKCKNIII